MASGLASVPAWDRIGDTLPWYRQVATNDRPAKYLIARRVPVGVDLDADADALWDAHVDATERLLDRRRAIDDGQLTIDALAPAEPSLMDLSVELVDRMLSDCVFCRWRCEVDRTADPLEKGERREDGDGPDKPGKRGTCQLAETSRVGSFFHHRGEEDVFRGTEGSGTIFFSSCNMRCSFCQNGRISTDKDRGLEMTPEDLALAAWQLRLEGCHNVNWVGGEPAIHLHTIVRAIAELGWLDPDPGELERIGQVKSDRRAGLVRFPSATRDPANADHRGRFNVPILWNSNFFLSEEALRILRPLVDVWLPDFKFGPGECAVELSRTPWYWETLTRNLERVHAWGEDVLVRHLVMPNHVDCCTEPVLGWLADHAPDWPVNVMDQFHPDCRCDPSSEDYEERYEEISRRSTHDEIRRAYGIADDLGLRWETLSLEG